MTCLFYCANSSRAFSRTRDCNLSIFSAVSSKDNKFSRHLLPVAYELLANPQNFLSISKKITHFHPEICPETARACSKVRSIELCRRKRAQRSFGAKLTGSNKQFTHFLGLPHGKTISRTAGHSFHPLFVANQAKIACKIEEENILFHFFTALHAILVYTAMSALQVVSTMNYRATRLDRYKKNTQNNKIYSIHKLYILYFVY